MLESAFKNMKKDIKEVIVILERQLKTKKNTKKDKNRIKELLDKWK